MKNQFVLLALVASVLSLNAHAGSITKDMSILTRITRVELTISTSDNNSDKLIAGFVEDDAKHFLLTGESTEALNEAIELLKGNNEDLALADAQTVAQKIVAQEF